jgi:chromosomal replication initiation ATPase DnaA
MSTQLSFDLPARAALGRDDFFISPSNALAVAMIDTPDTWSNGKLLLIGPKGSGKTHLAHVWAAQSGARIISALTLQEDDVPDLLRTPLVIEDIDQITKDHALETALFHLHNLAQAEGRALLFTAKFQPQHWGLNLPAPDVSPFLALRIDRSFAAAQQVVAALDKAALDAGRAITRAFASAALDKIREDSAHSDAQQE